MPRRSVLFTPGNRPDMMRSAADTDADVLVFDLEDAVAPDDKAAAREATRDVLADPSFSPAAEVLVRVNPVGLEADADLEVLADGDVRLDGVMLPKAGDADDVDALAAMLTEHDLPERVLPLVESAAGILHADTIAAADATVALAFGAEDLAADIGATRSDEGLEVLHARQHVVLAAAAADVDAIDSPYTEYEDDEGLTVETRSAARLGYDGKLAIHPRQVGPINDSFTPDADDVAWARRVLAARESADGGVFSVDGEMIDAPLLAQAERILDRADGDSS